MKKSASLLAVAAFALFAQSVSAQTNVNIPFNTGQVTHTFNSGPNTAFFNFFDNGGAGANYSNGSNPATSVITFTAAPGERVLVEFTAFQTENGWDPMYVHDGATTASPLIASGNGAAISGFPPGGWWGSGAPGNVAPNQVLSSGNSITFTFATDGSVTFLGWNAQARIFASAELTGTLTDAPDPVLAGNNLTYTATLNNAGPNAAQDANITLPLPAGTSLVSATASAGGICNALSPVVCTWAGATAPGTPRTATIVATVAANTPAGTMLNATATFASPTSDPTPGNNTASTTTTVGTDANLSITLTDSPDPVIAGNQLTYVATLTNGGPSDAQNASISLPLPAGTSFVSATPSAGGTCNAVSPVVCSWAGGTAPAGTRTATIVVLVAPSVANATVLSATATAASATNDSTPGNNGATTTTTVNTNANLSITLTDSPDPVSAGSQLTYVATLTNGGPSDAQGANISLPLPAGTSFVSATPSAGGTCNAVSPVVCTWAGATAPAATRTATIVALVAANVANGTVLSATATAASTTTDPTPANNTATATTTVNVNANLSITLTDSPDPVIAGTQLTYAATLTNGGPSDAQGANITLPLPAGTSFVSATPSAGGTCNAVSPVVCTWAGATAPAATRTAMIVVLVAANVVQGTVLSATATAASTTPDPTPANNTATTTTTVNANADLSITLTDSPDPVVAGTQLTYVATLTNGGPSDAQGANISLPLPAGTSFVSATPSAGGTCNATSPVVCTWAGATVPAATRSATIVVLVAPAQTAPLSATATAASTTTDPVAGNNSATQTTTVLVQADLSVTLTDAPDPVVAGTQLTYTATVTNAGPSDATTVSLSLPQPTGTSFVSGTVSGGGSCAAGVTCTVTGSMAPGSTRTITIVVLVAPSVLEGTVINATATVSAGSPDPNAGNNSASTTTTVIARADLQLALSASVPEVLINVPVTFTATSLNNGPSDAQNLSITVTLTPDFRYSSHQAAGATCTTPQVGNTGAIVCTWAGATAPGVTRTLTVVAYSNVEGNTAVSASTTSATTDPTPANNAAGVVVIVGYPFTAIPALDLRGLLLLAMLMMAIGFVTLRRPT